MTRLPGRTALLLCTTVLAAGCAGPSATPEPDAPLTATNPPSCADLRAGIAREEESRRTALEQQQDAWKAVIPFAIAARHASAKAAAGDAEERLRTLRDQYTRNECTPKVASAPAQPDGSPRFRLKQ